MRSHRAHFGLSKYSLQLGRSQVKRCPPLLHEEIAPSPPNLSFDELCKKGERFLAAEIARLRRDGRRGSLLEQCSARYRTTPSSAIPSFAFLWENSGRRTNPCSGLCPTPRVRLSLTVGLPTSSRDSGHTHVPW